MPWLIDSWPDSAGRTVSCDSFDLFERVITSDHEILSLHQNVQYNLDHIPDPQNLIPLRRAEYEFGRCFYKLRRPRKTLPARAIHTWYCDRFKKILEEIEPGKHRFAQIDIRMPDGMTPWPEPYWYWWCGNLIDAIVPAIGDDSIGRSGEFFWNSDLGCLVSRRNVPFGTSYPIARDRPVLNQSAILGQSAWRDAGFRYQYNSKYFFLSDEFYDRLRAVKAVMGLNVEPVAVSDVEATRTRKSGT